MLMSCFGACLSFKETRSGESRQVQGKQPHVLRLSRAKCMFNMWSIFTDLEDTNPPRNEEAEEEINEEGAEDKKQRRSSRQAWGRRGPPSRDS